MNETIFALSTPPGKSGVAVIRVSGPQARETLAGFGVACPLPRQATLAHLTLPDGSPLDSGLVLYFAGPHSFTGEDVVEYHVHGSRAGIAKLLARLGELSGLRPAHPGEFTRRAYLSGKMDLTMAEGIADLIDAETESQRRQALRLMEGHAQVFYARLREGALESLALFEAYIDFPEEDIPESVLAEARARIEGLITLIEGQLAGAKASERVREGVRVAIIGPPNAGKSSLMNRLAQRDVAIVSPLAGTTRDVIEVHLDLAGYAVIVADTAGLREAEGEIEREGIRRSVARAEAADIRLLLLDAAELKEGEDFHALLGPETIVVVNKIDKVPSPALPAWLSGFSPVLLSAKDGTGMEALLERLEGRVAENAQAESSFAARGRHRHHLREAAAHLNNVLKDRALPLELLCEELRRAAVEIGNITGEIAPDEVLGQIFSRFCIGK